MKPKHFWWLQEAENGEAQSRKLPKSEKDAILDAMNGNPKGSFW